MLLTVDIGNTNLTLGVYKDDALVFSARLATDQTRTADQYAAELDGVLRVYGCAREAINGAILSSVVPPVGGALRQAIRMLFGVKPLVVGPGVKTGLNIKIDNPAQLGADLAAGAVGALAKYKPPCIVIDLGTATTLCVLDRTGTFLGGAIAAGVRCTMDALTSHTAQLPLIEIEPPQQVIGRNSIDCMKSGLVIGAAAMIDGLVGAMERELGERTTVVATGGLAGMIVPHCTREILLDEYLLLDGLRLIWEKNKK